MRPWWILGGLLVAAGLLAIVLRQTERPLVGPQPVAWDHEACAQCRMLVSEPGFAAQIVRAHDVRHFDDPGCLFLLVGDGEARGQVWFHHQREDRWLAAADVGFLPVDRSPMGYRLAAVDRSAPGALSFEEARRRVLSSKAGHPGGAAAPATAPATGGGQ